MPARTTSSRAKKREIDFGRSSTSGHPVQSPEKVNDRPDIDVVERASIDSFPASDPPSWICRVDHYRDAP
jgi:hypothetical protein